MRCAQEASGCVTLENPGDRPQVPLRVLYVTRRYPPSVGGMQTLAAGVWRTLSAASPHSVLVAHKGSNRTLPFWVPFALGRTAFFVVTGRVDLVLAGDAVMYAAARPLLRLLGARSAVMVIGLDMTYANRAYRAVVRRVLRHAELLIAISESTGRVARELGAPAGKVRVIRLGVDAPEVTPADRWEARARLNEEFGTTNNQILLLTLGRLVKRKGVVWFLSQVLPRLPEHVILIVAGEGPEAVRVRQTVDDLSLHEKVLVLGQVDDDKREQLLRGTDLFVQPNVPVQGDIEGFGLVTIEAAIRGLPVVAADLEGLSDAVVDGVTGALLPAGAAEAWVRALSDLTVERECLAQAGETFQRACRERYSERIMGADLFDALGMVAPDDHV
jgi:phosphatidyl-myo-inositol dimannoside synthase